ncbi:uncharacterized protein TNIN_291031 [Trichonephila inaurata madagascariensis]|uniref:Uncharacterized protein n=1 Tax=Trichonephila inaurata madagascariensis TaxID=2747483 RepID=A0A8X6XCP9_9ARAC|nr:uncharacterized protein TNIN_291031 [Trichonephila inaurata madagascariensis]
MKSEFVADAWSNFSVFYVYSNIISPQIVGDTQAPLLRIVRTKGQIGSDLTHDKGINFQKGYGIGGIFRRLFRAALPFLVKGGKTIGKEVLMTGSRVASDVLSGENFKEAVKTRSRESGKKLAQKAIDRVQSMVGKGQYKRKRKKQKKFISSKARKFDGLEQAGLETEHVVLGVIVHCWDSGPRRQWVCSLNGLDKTPLLIL